MDIKTSKNDAFNQSAALLKNVIWYFKIKAYSKMIIAHYSPIRNYKVDNNNTIIKMKNGTQILEKY